MVFDRKKCINKVGRKKGIIPWNKGLTKETDERMKQISEALKGRTSCNKGIPRSKKTKRKIGESQLGEKNHNYGKHFSKETKKKMSKSHTGKKLSKEHRKSISKARKGVKFSKKHKKQISETRKRLFKEGKLKVIGSPFKKGNIPHNKGKKLSEKTRRKLSEAHKGKKLSKETRRKISEGHKGEKNSMYGMTGELSPGWKDGLSFEPYTKEFNKQFKNKIRKRDNQVCMLCEIHREKLKRALDVHHINYDKKLSFPQNCISLCNSCHMKTNSKRKYWTKFFQSLLEEKYGYKYKNNLIVYNLLEDKS